MAYTVKKLAKLSGVSVRTLHWYDEVGLLKPAYYGANGYRHYEEEQLLILQQILFFKELGFELQKIQEILGRSDFDKIAALSSHRHLLLKGMDRTRKLIETIDKTINHLKGVKQMKAEEIYEGISKEKQQEYLAYMKNRVGEDHPSFAEAEENVKKMTKEDQEEIRQEGQDITMDLMELMVEGFATTSPEVQRVIERHYAWIKRFWTPDRQAYIYLGKLYLGFEWKNFFGKFDPNHPRLAKFQAEGMKVFAEANLPA